MRAIATETPPGDGAGVFNNVYLRVTDHVARPAAVAAASFPTTPSWPSLTARFASFWFAAYDAHGDKAAGVGTTVRQPLAPRRATHPVRTGRNERHIEHDLPLAVISTCTARRRTPTSPGLHDDYEKINDLLADAEAEIRRSFLTELEQAVDDHLNPVAHLISAWSIDKARDFAWLNAQTLWELRQHEPAVSGVRRRPGQHGRHGLPVSSHLDRLTARRIRATLILAPGRFGSSATRIIASVNECDKPVQKLWAKRLRHMAVIADDLMRHLHSGAATHWVKYARWDVISRWRNRVTADESDSDDQTRAHIV